MMVGCCSAILRTVFDHSFKEKPRPDLEWVRDHSLNMFELLMMSTGTSFWGIAMGSSGDIAAPNPAAVIIQRLPRLAGKLSCKVLRSTLEPKALGREFPMAWPGCFAPGKQQDLGVSIHGGSLKCISRKQWMTWGTPIFGNFHFRMPGVHQRWQLVIWQGKIHHRDAFPNVSHGNCWLSSHACFLERTILEIPTIVDVHVLISSQVFCNEQDMYGNDRNDLKGVDLSHRVQGLDVFDHHVQDQWIWQWLGTIIPVFRAAKGRIIETYWKHQPAGDGSSWFLLLLEGWNLMEHIKCIRSHQSEKHVGNHEVASVFQIDSSLWMSTTGGNRGNLSSIWNLPWQCWVRPTKWGRLKTKLLHSYQPRGMSFKRDCKPGLHQVFFMCLLILYPQQQRCAVTQNISWLADKLHFRFTLSAGVGPQCLLYPWSLFENTTSLDSLVSHSTTATSRDSCKEATGLYNGSRARASIPR